MSRCAISGYECRVNLCWCLRCLLPLIEATTKFSFRFDTCFKANWDKPLSLSLSTLSTPFFSFYLFLFSVVNSTSIQFFLCFYETSFLAFGYNDMLFHFIVVSGKKAKSAPISIQIWMSIIKSVSEWISSSSVINKQPQQSKFFRKKLFQFSMNFMWKLAGILRVYRRKSRVENRKKREKQR